MKNMSVREFRQNLSEVIDAAQRGEPTVITRRGKPVAKVSNPDVQELKPFPDLTEFGKRIKIRGESIVETLIKERRKARA